MREIVTGMLAAMMLVLVSGGRTLTSPSQSRAETCLVAAATPVSAIVLDGKATRSAQFAAEELRYHIRQITGAELPIVADATKASGVRIFVGESAGTRALGLKSADFTEQEYLVRVKDDTIVLMGRDAADPGKVDYGNYLTFPGDFDERGTCYAVYDFLERCCDVRWYLPTELGLVCPKSGTLKVKDVESRRAPAMKYRWVEIRPEASYAADLCGDTIPGPEKPKMLAPRELKLWLARHRLGGAKYACNHSFEGYPERFLKDHPDWFAKGYPGEPPQMCYTNPEFTAQVIQDARDYFDGKGLKPGGKAMGDFFALEPMDNRQYCKCDACRALMLDKPKRGVDFSTDQGSDYWWSFVRKVAEAVGRSHSGKYLSTLAYREHAYPPSGKPLPPNVAVQCCLHGRMVYAPELNENDRRILQAWTAGEPKRPVYVWTYYCFPTYCGIHDNFRVFPGFFAHAIVEDMKRYHDAGVRGVFVEPAYVAQGVRSALFDQIEFVVTWKLADDPTLDGDRLIDEFFERYYGKAAGPMRKFYDLVEKTYCDPASYPKGFRGQQTEEIAWKWLGTDERMAELGKLMAQATAAAQTEAEKARVALFDKGVWQYMKKGKAEYDKIGKPEVADGKGKMTISNPLSADELDMSTTDAAQGKPFVIEYEGHYIWKDQTSYWVKGQNVTALTDAQSGNAPAADACLCANVPEKVIRLDMKPVPAEGRQLRKIRVFWSLRDQFRNRVCVRFAVRDSQTKQWSDITSWLTAEEPRVEMAGYYKVMTLEFPEGVVTGFDQLRLIDGTGDFFIANANDMKSTKKWWSTRFVEVDVFTEDREP